MKKRRNKFFDIRVQFFFICMAGFIGVALLAADAGPITGAESGPFVSGTFDFEAMLDFDFKTREIECQKCANHCEIVCVYKDDTLIDAWGNRCDKGAIKVGK